MNADNPPYLSYTNSYYGELPRIKPFHPGNSVVKYMESPPSPIFLGSATSECRGYDHTVNDDYHEGYSNNTGGGKKSYVPSQPSYYVARTGMQKQHSPPNLEGVTSGVATTRLRGAVKEKLMELYPSSTHEKYHIYNQFWTRYGVAEDDTEDYQGYAPSHPLMHSVANKGLQKQRGLTNLNGVTSSVGNGVVAKNFVVLN